MMIIKNGEVKFENYELGVEASTHWISFSVAKSFASTLVGAALQDGSIKSLDDQLTQYVPELKGSGYDGVSVRQLLQMSSSVRWDETYTDPKSDRRKLLDQQLTNTPGNVLAYMRTLPKAGPPGSIWNYNTGETIVVGSLLEAATKKPLAEYLSQKIWAPWGMESDGMWWLESPNGSGIAGSGLLSTMRDFARFGLFVLADGVIDGKRVVPAGWFAEATTPKMIGGKLTDYGYFWWPIPKGDPIHDGAYQGRGIFGQFIYINPRENLVIVVLSARAKPTGYFVITDNDFFGAVAKALR
jgi:CubicO group peptidase (beta-lactamase class C family)